MRHTPEKEKLRALRSGLDPVKLRQRIQQKLRRIFALNKEEAAPGKSTAEARS